MFGIPQDTDFFCKQADPFADTPDWSSVASEESNYNQLEGETPTTTTNRNEQSSGGNPFASSIIDSPLNHNVNQDLDSNTNNDRFLDYLSNVVAQRTNGTGLNNSVANGNGVTNGTNGLDPYTESTNGNDNNNNNNNNCIDANFAHFNANDNIQFNNNSFNQLDLKDASTINETDDGFFPDDDFIQRPKAHTITVLTHQNMPPRLPFADLHGNKSNLTASGNAINELDESTYFPEESFDESFRQKSKSFSPSSNQVVRPRPSSFCVLGHNLPAPPTKSSLKKPTTTCIKTPTMKVLSSTPTREDFRMKTSPDNEKPPSSPSYILPNIRNTAPQLELRSRTRSRGQQSATPLKESICRASKSLEDLCSIDSSQTSANQSPPKMRRQTNPFASPPMQQVQR